MKNVQLSFLLLFTFYGTWAQSNYIAPADTLVAQKLQQWQDLKFGLFMHWSICPEDEGWTQRKGPLAADYFEYKRAYENLQTSFNPKQFHPENWVRAAKEAGM